MNVRSSFPVAVFGAIVALWGPSICWTDVVFELAADQCSTQCVAVNVAGSFNDWCTTDILMMRQGDTWWAATPLDNGRYYYKFVWLDAEGNTHWMLDPAHPYLADNGICGANNVFDVISGRRVTPTDGMEHFRFQRSGCNWVAVAGDFNDWRLGQFPLCRTTEDNWEIWHAWIELKRPLSYRFIYDGWWTDDMGPEQWPRVPNGFGRYNSYRPADGVTSPETVTLVETVRAGDESLLQRVEAYNHEADFGRAVKLARAVAAANETAAGTTSPLRLCALDLEAKLHRRWARYDEAARCWEKITAVDRDTSETRTAVRELAAYYTYITKDREAARRLCERAIVRMGRGSAELVQIITRHIEATFKEGRCQEVIDEAALWLEALPPPDGEDKPYACQLSELLLYKAIAHERLGQWEAARQASRTLIDMHPYEDSQNVMRARNVLQSVDILEARQNRSPR